MARNTGNMDGVVKNLFSENSNMEFEKDKVDDDKEEQSKGDEETYEESDGELNWSVHDLGDLSESFDSPTRNEASSRTQSSGRTESDVSTPTQSQSREFCLILFNNPRWTDELRREQRLVCQTISVFFSFFIILFFSFNIDQHDRRAARLAARLAARQEQMPSGEDAPPQRAVLLETKSEDEEFVAQLRTLVYDYMRRTTRPFPLRYFIELLEQ